MIINFVSVAAATAVATVTLSASGEILASWTMNHAIPTGTVGNSYAYGAADSGVNAAGSMLSGYHALATTVYSSPAGNGSQYSFSSNAWSAGDFYQVSVSSAGFDHISIDWDQTRSSTGPLSFGVWLSNDGVNFLSVATYGVQQAGAVGSNTTSWNVNVNQIGFTGGTGPVPFSGGGMAYFRFVSMSTTAAAGTSRIDNIVVSGIPAPGALALLGMAGLLVRRRR